MHRLEKNILHHAKKQREQRKYLLNNEYKIIELNNGNYIQIKYDIEGVVYDKFNNFLSTYNLQTSQYKQFKYHLTQSKYLCGGIYPL
jgi:hypothetical protein